MLSVLGVLKRFKGLRGTLFDPFGYTAERRAERELIAEYEQTVATILGVLGPESLKSAVAYATWPDMVRGFGPIKERSIAEARTACATRADTFAKAANSMAVVQAA